MMFPAIFFLLSIALALCGQTNVCICSESVENIIGILVVIALLLEIVLGCIAIFKTFSLPVTISKQDQVCLTWVSIEEDGIGCKLQPVKTLLLRYDPSFLGVDSTNKPL